MIATFASIETERIRSGERRRTRPALARYFRMSEGFFLRLQDSFEIREAKRALNGDLERMVPRAA